jgi:hypothetical protein
MNRLIALLAVLVLAFALVHIVLDDSRSAPYASLVRAEGAR